MYQLRIDQTEPIDAAWYSRLCYATKGISETFILLEPDQRHLAKERQRFFAADCSVNPDLRPENLDLDYYSRTLEGLIKLQKEISVEEPNEYIREAYVRHIQDYVTTLEMLLAVGRADHAAFVAKNIELYGEPSFDIISSICAWLRQDTLTTAAINDPKLGVLRDDVLRLLPDIPGDPAIIIPDADVFTQVRELHFTPGGYFDQLFAPIGIPTVPYVDQKLGDEYTRQAITNAGSDYTIKTATDGLWSVLSRSHQVVRPLGYRVDRDYFTGVIAHEVGSHLLEEANGSRQPLRLLGLGLNGFEKGNEGRAYLREQIMYPSASVFVRQASWEYILILHLSVSLAHGILGREYTFVELYELLNALHRFWRHRRFPLDTINDEQASEEAWYLCVRIMKGTDGTGGCYMKDTVYLEGNLACWTLAEHDPSLLLYGDIGKFNITDPRHIAILRGLDILPAIG
jgi:hypothetical protein